MKLFSWLKGEEWDKKYLGFWEKWYAWHPVVIEDGDERSCSMVWLCWVERKGYRDYSGVGYRYRELLK